MLLNKPESRLDPQEIIKELIQILPAETGLFRNVIPRSLEGMIREAEAKAWENQI
jgi:hypothetical protein